MVEKLLSVDEIVKNLENLKNDIEVIFSVDALEYLKKVVEYHLLYTGS